MAPFATIRFAVRTGIATVTLNRPRHHNAFNVQMRDDLWEAFTAVRDDPGIRGVLLRGAGDSFCAGADLTEFGTAPSQIAARRVRWERDLWGLMLGIPKPMVAAVHGHCIGSGVEMACVCDLRIVADDTTFRMPEAHLGLLPAATGTQLLPRIVGTARAFHWLFTGAPFNASHALRYGLATTVVPAPNVDRASRALLHRVLRAPDAALRAAKHTVNEGADLSLAPALALEHRIALQLLRGIRAR